MGGALVSEKPSDLPVGGALLGIAIACVALLILALA
jgi:hypothetical protein